MSGGADGWALAFAAGAGFGAVYLALLWAGARALAGPRAHTAFALLAVARLALVLATLAGAALLGVGATELVAMLAGFVAVRAVMTRWARGPMGGSAWR